MFIKILFDALITIFSNYFESISKVDTIKSATYNAIKNPKLKYTKKSN